MKEWLSAIGSQLTADNCLFSDDESLLLVATAEAVHLRDADRRERRHLFGAGVLDFTGDLHLAIDVTVERLDQHRGARHQRRTQPEEVCRG